MSVVSLPSQPLAPASRGTSAPGRVQRGGAEFPLPEQAARETAPRPGLERREARDPAPIDPAPLPKDKPRADRPVRAEARPERPERPDRPEKPATAQSEARPERPDRPDRPDRAAGCDHQEVTDEADKDAADRTSKDAATAGEALLGLQASAEAAESTEAGNAAGAEAAAQDPALAADSPVAAAAAPVPTGPGAGSATAEGEAVGQIAASGAGQAVGTAALPGAGPQAGAAGETDAAAPADGETPPAGNAQPPTTETTKPERSAHAHAHGQAGEGRGEAMRSERAGEIRAALEQGQTPQPAAGPRAPDAPLPASHAGQPATPAPVELARAMPPSAVPVEVGLRALQGLKEFQIRLDPAELGRVDVKLEIGDDKTVTAKVVVDRVETLHLLQRDAKTLERAFEQAGLKSSDGGIDITLRDPGQQARQGRDEGFSDELAGRERGRSEAGALPEAQPIPVRRMIRAGGLDLSI